MDEYGLTLTANRCSIFTAAVIFGAACLFPQIIVRQITAHRHQFAQFSISFYLFLSFDGVRFRADAHLSRKRKSRIAGAKRPPARLRQSLVFVTHALHADFHVDSPRWPIMFGAKSAEVSGGGGKRREVSDDEIASRVKGAGKSV